MVGRASIITLEAMPSLFAFFQICSFIVPIVNFLITGINSSNKLATYTLGTKFSIHEHIPSEHQCLCTALYSAQNNLDFPSYMRQKMRSGFITEDMITTAIRNYIIAVSQIDTSVNTNITFMKITL